MNKISLITHISGDDKLRTRNFLAQVESLKRQTVKEFEFIVVERGTHNYKQYHNGIHISIDGEIYHRGWELNVGARIASGTKLILLDGDIVLPSDYLERISRLFYLEYALGWSSLVKLNEAGTQRFLDDWYFDFWVSEIISWHQAPGDFFTATSGGVVYFDRDFYWDQMGGCNENFVGWGGTDNEIMIRAEAVTGSHNLLHPMVIPHLYHTVDGRKVNSDRMRLLRITREKPYEVCQKLVKANLGNLQHPIRIQMI